MKKELDVTNLHEYQRRAVDFILDKKVCALFISMGLGKTISTLTAIDRLIHSMEVRKVLVVAPLAVAKNVWEQEAANWGHTKDLRITVVTGPLKQRIEAISTEYDVMVINRENLPWLIAHYGSKMPFEMLVIDESSSFKSHAAQRFKKLRKVVGQFRYVVALTATPAPDKLIGLWSQMYLLDFGISLGRTWTAYTKEFFNTAYNGFGMTLKPDGAERIYEKVEGSGMVLSLAAEDYLKMPSIVYDKCMIDMEEKVYAGYMQTLKSGILTLDESTPATAALSAAGLINKMLQYCNGAVYDEQDEALELKTKTWTHVHDSKLDMLESILETIDEPVIVAYSFRHDLERIQKRINGVSTIKDEGVVKRWNEGKVPVLCLHPACLHPETEILTEFRGWVKIVDIKRDERVFDGIEFVSHKGCSYSGVKPVIQVAGVTLTPNHKILVDDKWVEAKYVQNDTDFRRKARYTYSGNDAYLGEMLQLPKGKCYYEAEFRQGEFTTTKTLRRVSWGRFSPYDKHSNLADMDTHGESGDEVQRPKLQALWGHWSRGVRKLVTVFKFLRGYAFDVCGQSDTRQDRQQSRVFKGKLPVGYKCCPAGEQVEQPSIGLHGYKNAFGGILPSSKCFTRCDNTTVKQRYESRGSTCGLQGFQVSEEPKVSDVYDLVDCGPRSRFVIKNKEGDVFISHNSSGHGINLQAGGSRIIWFGLPWSLEHWLQMNGRVYRQGQTKPVIITTLMTRNTVESRVLESLQSKEDLQSNLLNLLRS